MVHSNSGGRWGVSVVGGVFCSFVFTMVTVSLFSYKNSGSVSTTVASRRVTRTAPMGVDNGNFCCKSSRSVNNGAFCVPLMARNMVTSSCSAAKANLTVSLRLVTRRRVGICPGGNICGVGPT